MKTTPKTMKQSPTVLLKLNTGETVSVQFENESRAKKFYQDCRAASRFMDAWITECQLISKDSNAKLD